MTVAAILVGWQVINKFTNSDHIVMAIRTKCRRVNVNRAMTKETASESTRNMADTAVLVRRHMVERFTKHRNTMTGVAVFTHNIRAGVIDEGAGENIGVMTITTIRLCLYMFGHRG